MGALPYEDGTFDIVLSLNGFHAFPDKEAAYREVFRVLKTRLGGVYADAEVSNLKSIAWFVCHKGAEQ